MCIHLFCFNVAMFKIVNILEMLKYFLIQYIYIYIFMSNQIPKSRKDMLRFLPLMMVMVKTCQLYYCVDRTGNGFDAILQICCC